MTSLVLLSVLLCLIAGSAIDTGSVCVVRAVRDGIAGKPALALGCLVTLLCAAVVFTLDTTLNWQLQSAPWAWPTLRILIGAGIFAAGAVLNGACAVGTVTRLCRGDIGYVATLIGALAMTLLVPKTLLPTGAAAASTESAGLAWLAVIALVTLPPLLILRRYLAWRIVLSYAAVGLIAATLANLQGDWTWLRLFQEAKSGVPIRWDIVACIAAIVVGATATALYRRRFRLIRPDPLTMLREAAGGALMAAGALLIPGGNDLLLVYSLPSGSPHAIAAYVLIVAVMLLLLGLFQTARRWVVWPVP
ncbi:MAG: YeeE/YedE family protein [Proteobacteria bacterium]|nr:YeeE/YedE family protein [Pseudomonadota bacterium]